MWSECLTARDARAGVDAPEAPGARPRMTNSIEEELADGGFRCVLADWQQRMDSLGEFSAVLAYVRPESSDHTARRALRLRVRALDGEVPRERGRLPSLGLLP